MRTYSLTEIWTEKPTYHKMMKLKYLTAAFFILTVFSQKSFAQFGDLGSNRVATSSFQFLKIGVGARETAMAETGISISNDANALFWNPSHITYIPAYSSSFSYNLWYADIYQTALATTFKFESLSSFQIENEYLKFLEGFVKTLGYFNYGISVNYLSTEAMNRTTTFQPMGTGEKFNYYDIATGLTIASQMTAQFSFGLTGKYVREQLAEVKFSTFVLDLGMTYILDDNDTKLSIALLNFGGRSKPSGNVTASDLTSTNLNYQEYNAPSNFRLGFSYIAFKNDDNRILTAVQLNHPNDGSENYSAGFEYGYLQTFFLRTGLKLNVENQKVPSFGFGINKTLLTFDAKLDYAASYIDKLGFAHRLTLSLNLPEGDLR